MKKTGVIMEKWTNAILLGYYARSILELPGALSEGSKMDSVVCSYRVSSMHIQGKYLNLFISVKDISSQYQNRSLVRLRITAELG